MTYNDVYKKFMIEYDKADISSSYPSLTIYETATILDKAMLALIAQKVTGNNPRQSVLDSDIKSSSDIQQLLTIQQPKQTTLKAAEFKNEKTVEAPEDVLYLIKTYLLYGDVSQSQVAQVISSILADKFRQTSTNIPWIKNPVCFLENDQIHILMDPKCFDKNNIDKYMAATVSPYYVRKPKMFTDTDTDTNKTMYIKTNHEVPLSDSACEELINLAIIFACKSVENPRVSTEIQTKSLEA